MPAVRVWALVLLVGLGLCGCSEGPDASAEKPRRPNVLLIVFVELGGDTLLGPNGKIDLYYGHDPDARQAMGRVAQHLGAGPGVQVFSR